MKGLHLLHLYPYYGGDLDALLFLTVSYRPAGVSWIREVGGGTSIYVRDINVKLRAAPSESQTANIEGGFWESMIWGIH